MGNAMLASEMTDGQIDDLANKLRDAARKHRDEIGTEAAQVGLRSENIGMRLFAEFRKIVQEVSGCNIRLVAVNRARTPLAALKACGRALYVNEGVAKAMPKGSGEKATLTYFKPDPSVYQNGRLSSAALAEEYRKRGLKPDPQAQIDDNTANPDFADVTPNACQWVDADGRFCYLAFYRWLGERRVRVRRRDDDWDVGWSFAGVPQVSAQDLVPGSS